MLLAKRTFKHEQGAAGGFYMSSGEIRLCKKDFFRFLRNHFNLPLGTSPVTVSLLSRPGKHRQEFDVVKSTKIQDEAYPALTAEGCEEIQEPSLDRLLKPLIGKIVWMEVEYEV